MITKIGAVVAPDFTLTDVHGQNVTLSDYRAARYVVLVLNRSLR